MSYKGKYKPEYPKKYKGDPTNIIYRSSYELKFMNWCDMNEDIQEWGSEEIAIPYRSPLDNKIHRYFPDFIVKKKNNTGNIETVVIEVKPKSQTSAPKVQKRATRRYVNEVYTWGVNSAKWKAAQNFCEDRKWKFVIMTEEDLGIKV